MTSHRSDCRIGGRDRVVRDARPWPTTTRPGPIHVLTTSSAGGISDIFMRVLGEELHKSLGQPLIIENRPGGSGNIGARACQDAQPDGYTICIINADPMIYNQYLFKNLAVRSGQARRRSSTCFI